MSELAVSTFAARNKGEPGLAQLRDELPDVPRHTEEDATFRRARSSGVARALHNYSTRSASAAGTRSARPAAKRAARTIAVIMTNPELATVVQLPASIP